MELQDFMKKVVEGVAAKLGDGYTVEGKDILKNNGSVLHAAVVCTQGHNVTPCIYMDDFYVSYLAGNMGIQGIVEEALRIYRKNAVDPGFDTDLLRDYRNVSSRLRSRLINTERNRMFLADVPHRDFLDLSLVYTVELSAPDKKLWTIQVCNEHLKCWGVGEAELYETALRNMEAPDKAVLKSMEAVIREMTGCDAGPDTGECPIYVLSNRNHLNGAVQILNSHMLKSAAGIMGNSDLAILPSSVHELLLVPADGGMDCAHQLAGIVREVNDTQVAESDILSYHVYHYCNETEEITIAA